MSKRQNPEIGTSLPKLEAWSERNDRVSEKRESSILPYLEAIKRPDLKDILTEKTPWVYWTMEIYRDDIKGGGGLGMLASDTLEVARKENIPAVFITPFYTEETFQEILNSEPVTRTRKVKPEERGFEQIATEEIKTWYFGRLTPTELKVYLKKEGSVKIYALTEPSFGSLYQGDKASDHRLYQEIALGIGGFKALRRLGVSAPAYEQLNEAPTVFGAMAQLDELNQKFDNFDLALAEVRETTIYTNHTLAAVAEAEFTEDQFERFLMPNLKSEAVKNWLRDKLRGRGGRLKLSALAIELAGKKNGVSLLHAREASRIYKDSNGKTVEFFGITNGIAFDRWGDKDLLALYHEAGVLDKFDLPGGTFEDKINNLDEPRLGEIKAGAKRRLREYLKTRQDENGEPVTIPEQAKIYDWARRIVGYKRPGMMFEWPDKLADILEINNIHIVMAGRTHSSDDFMKSELRRIFSVIDNNEILKKRVHFIADYDEELARNLAQGVDVSLNTPTVRNEAGSRISTEACGTSWAKKILGNAILISTDDGGVADYRIRAGIENQENSEVPYLEIKGMSLHEEVSSLYNNMRRAAEVLDGPDKFKFLKKQLEAYLPIIAGARMETDYLNMAFPRV